MTLFLNQIFYNCNKFDNIQSIESLKCFMLNNDNYKEIQKDEKQEVPIKILDSLKQIVEVESSVPVEIPISEPEKAMVSESINIFFPQRENSLFWCLFISHYDKAEYDFIGKKYANRELEEKQKIINYIKENSMKLKESNHRITNIMIKEIISELMVTKNSSLLELFALCLFYKKNVYIVNGRTYIYYSYDKSEKYNFENQLILEYKNGNYGIDMNITEEKINNIKNNLFCLEHIDKPLKALSNYKMSDLEEISIKLQLSLTTALKKNDLYNKILELCVWDNVKRF